VNAHIGFQSITQPIPGFLEVKISLEPHPERFSRAKIAGQTQCRTSEIIADSLSWM
jgi:hypothetical protein